MNNIIIAVFIVLAGASLWGYIETKEVDSLIIMYGNLIIANIYITNPLRSSSYD